MTIAVYVGGSVPDPESPDRVRLLVRHDPAGEYEAVPLDPITPYGASKAAADLLMLQTQGDALLRLLDTLNPGRVPGRMTLITRYGHDKAEYFSSAVEGALILVNSSLASTTVASGARLSGTVRGTIADIKKKCQAEKIAAQAMRQLGF